MKIGIITFHFAYNCGAALQCYALQSVLEEMGHEVVVIDYCPPYHKNLYRPLRDPFLSAKRAVAFCGRESGLLRRTVAWVKAFALAVLSFKNYKGMKKADRFFFGVFFPPSAPDASLQNSCCFAGRSPRL